MKSTKISNFKDELARSVATHKIGDNTVSFIHISSLIEIGVLLDC